MTTRRTIDEKSRGPVVVAYQHVHVAVVVDVAKCCTSANLRQGERGPGTSGHVLETAGATVLQQQLALVEGQGVARLSQTLDDLHGAVHRQQIQTAIVVEIEPRRAETREPQAGRAQSR